MEPPNRGDLMITLLAGRLTPDESVEVASRTRRDPERKPPSMISRSSKVRPEEEGVQKLWRKESYKKREDKKLSYDTPAFYSLLLFLWVYV